MRRLRSAAVLLGALASSVPLGACKPGDPPPSLGIIDVYRGLFGNPLGKVTHNKTDRLRESVDTTVDGSFGGLTGAYEISLNDWGTVAGTAEIKGQTRADIRSQDDDEVIALVEAALLDVFGQDVDVSSAMLEYDGRQTTGGVMKLVKVKIEYQGVVASGDDIGRRAKGDLQGQGGVLTPAARAAPARDQSCPTRLSCPAGSTRRHFP